MFEQCSDLLTIKDLQKVLRIGRNKAYELIQSGEVKSFKIGTGLRVPKSSVIDYVKRKCYNVTVVNGCAVTPMEVVV